MAIKMAAEESDDDWEEDTMVLVELAGVVDQNWVEYFTNTARNVRLLGVNTDNPMLQVERYIFTGQYQDAVGTAVMFELESDDSDDSSDDDEEEEEVLRHHRHRHREDKQHQLGYRYCSHKVLTMNRCFLEERAGHHQHGSESTSNPGTSASDIEPSASTSFATTTSDALSPPPPAPPMVSTPPGMDITPDPDPTTPPAPEETLEEPSSPKKILSTPPRKKVHQFSFSLPPKTPESSPGNNGGAMQCSTTTSDSSSLPSPGFNKRTDSVKPEKVHQIESSPDSAKSKSPRSIVSSGHKQSPAGKNRVRQRELRTKGKASENSVIKISKPVSNPECSSPVLSLSSFVREDRKSHSNQQKTGKTEISEIVMDCEESPIKTLSQDDTNNVTEQLLQVNLNTEKKEAKTRAKLKLSNLDLASAISEICGEKSKSKDTGMSTSLRLSPKSGVHIVTAEIHSVPKDIPKTPEASKPVETRSSARKKPTPPQIKVKSSEATSAKKNKDIDDSLCKTPEDQNVAAPRFTRSSGKGKVTQGTPVKNENPARTTRSQVKSVSPVANRRPIRKSQRHEPMDVDKHS